MLSTLESFNLDSVAPGEKRAQRLDICELAGGDVLRLPMLVVKGASPGPTIVVLGGVHGDEYEGPYAVRRLYGWLDPTEMSGTFVGISQTNPPAFATGTRTSPIDGVNLARIFPGDENGTPTERIAYRVAHDVIDRADFVIDLHSSGTYMTMPTLVGYDAGDTEAGRRSREAAFAFGAPVVWAHLELSPGRTVSRAWERGIPWLYTESPGGGWLSAESAGLYVRGVINVMKVMGILPGAVEAGEPTHHLCGSGDVDGSLTAGTAGYLVRDVEVLDRVGRGDVLGRVLAPDGSVVEEVRSPMDGVVIMMRMSPSVMPGTNVFMVTGVV